MTARSARPVTKPRDPTSGRHVALIRGINVARAKRVAMADLRDVVAGLGFGDVRTLLNSGNVVFTTPGRHRGDPARRIEEAMATRLGVSARVIVLTAGEVAAAVRNNPLGDVADDPSRLLVMVLADAKLRTQLEPLLEQRWDPDVLALGARVAYLWCPQGSIDSRLNAAVNRIVGESGTARNIATMTKLAALARGE